MEEEKNPEEMRSLMIDHIDSKLDGELAQYVKSHIEKNESAKAEYLELKRILDLVDNESKNLEEIPQGEREKFLAMLDEAKDKVRDGSSQEAGLEGGSDPNTPKKQALHFTLDPGLMYKIAAGLALVVIGFFGGRYLTRNDSNEIDQLRAEMKQTKELIMMSMMKENSASERIKGVAASYEIAEADEEILDVLITIMNSDDNLNVRLSAVDALEKFSSDEKVRGALVQSLRTQENPAVQIRLIGILVNLGEKRAVQPLQDLAHDETIMQTVRDEAQLGIFRLM